MESTADISRPKRTGNPLSVEVRDFGAMEHAEIELSPLTVFLGKNMTAKSYAAMLIYAIWESLGSPRAFLNLPFEPPPWSLGSPDVDAESKNDFRAVIEGLDHALRQGTLEAATRTAVGWEVPLDSLSAHQREVFSRVAKEQLQSFGSRLASELSRCFGAELSALVRADAKPPAFEVTWQQVSPDVVATISFREGKARTTVERVDLSGGSILVPRIPLPRGRPRPEVKQAAVAYATDTALASLWFVVTQAFRRRAYYLPAARSGILNARHAVASTLIRDSSRVGFETLSIPKFGGAGTDFLADLIQLDKSISGPVADVAHFIESNVLRGSLIIEKGPAGFPEIVFRQGSFELPLKLASSMVSELAPLVLYLKHSVKSGELLIIEEPESHLHPSAQRILARALVRMVKHGVNVVITTHSDYFLSQLNNLILIASLPPESRNKAGYAAEDALPLELVSAYLFALASRAQGEVAATTERLVVSKDQGIPTTQFDEIGIELHDEFADTFAELEKQS